MTVQSATPAPTVPGVVAGDVLVLAGPTASGKSALARTIAVSSGGVVINADSMQVYRDLAIVTARPEPADLETAPHRLYGVLGADERCSAARWRELALGEIGAALANGRLPIVVGGTGLYLRALMEGIADIPPIPQAVRQAARADRRRLGVDGFHARLAARDPATARRLPLGDSQRLIRAWEVLEATGRPLSDWHADRAPGAGPPPGLRFSAVVLDPPRPALHAACDGRFATMVERGALDEVRRLRSLEAVRRAGPEAGLPILKALGVPELSLHLEGAIPLDEAIARAQRATRRYAKRQSTWLRHQLVGRAAEAGVVRCHVLDGLYDDAAAGLRKDSERLRAQIFAKIRDMG